jgi:ubiquinone/menaquinone biosynthesis C-methylase UbiE
MNKIEIPIDGERLVTDFGGAMVCEHLHRYAIAAYFTEGVDVLDVACGEGYGAYFLSKNAKSVFGVDISEVAIAHAKEKYVSQNLAYVMGSATRIPVNDRSIDVVVSFETIEHVLDQEGFMREITRVLKPSGVLIMSSPDKRVYSEEAGYGNPYHVKELYHEDFLALVRRSFSCVVEGKQLHQEGSIICFNGAQDHEQMVGSYTGAEKFDIFTRGVYSVVVASDSPVHQLSNSYFKLDPRFKYGDSGLIRADAHILGEAGFTRKLSQSRFLHEGDKLTLIFDEISRFHEVGGPVCLRFDPINNAGYFSIESIQLVALVDSSEILHDFDLVGEITTSHNVVRVSSQGAEFVALDDDPILYLRPVSLGSNGQWALKIVYTAYVSQSNATGLVRSCVDKLLNKEIHVESQIKEIKVAYEDEMVRLSAEANERMQKRIEEVSEGYEKEIARVGEENRIQSKNIEAEWIARNDKLKAEDGAQIDMRREIEKLYMDAKIADEKIKKMEKDPFWRVMLPIRRLGQLIKNELFFSGAGVEDVKVDIASDGGRVLIINVGVGPEVMCRLVRVWVKIGDKRVDLLKNARGYYTQYRSGSGLKLITVIAKFNNGETKVIKHALRVVSGEKKEVPVLEQKSLKWGIVTPKHTLFIAKLVESGLKRHGYASAVFTDTAGLEFDLDMYVVICPQVFKNLPPGEKRICYQMEQSVSSRWFNKEYFDVLGNSFAVIEYALANMEFLAGNSIAFPHVHYLPVGNLIECISSGLWRGEKECDVLFYGDSYSSPRRRLMLDELSKVFVVKVVNDLFGAEMASVIKKAKLVLNLHYYENALLEMPRIQECLSHGVPVVSESSFDQNEYPEIEGVVSFFEQSSIPGMIAAVESMLAKPPTEGQIRSAVQRSAARFDYMLDRLLVALGFLPSLHVKQMIPVIEPGAKRVALSMPETIARRREFEAIKPQGCTVFDGIRRKPGWVGCGLSYMAIAQHAINNGMDTITVMEDDVILPVDFEDKMSIIGNYLSLKKGNWDVFSGLIASLNPEAVILEATNYQGILFVTLDKMTSTVCNVYNRTALEVLGSWDPNNLDSKVNTIDRYIENQRSLRVVTTIPFLVGHKEEVYSTLWGFKNTQYVEWIKNSEAGLREMVLKFNNKKQK